MTDKVLIDICVAHAARIRRPFGRCLYASERLAQALMRKGFDARILRCSKGAFEAPDADPRWLRLRGGSASWVHYVVKVETTIIDLTRRQYFPAAEHPHICDMIELTREWQTIEQVINQVPEGAKP